MASNNHPDGCAFLCQLARATHHTPLILPASCALALVQQP